MRQPDGTIRVHGHDVAAAVPDGIGFRLTLSANHGRSDEALQDVTARSERLDALLTELGLPHAARSTSGVSIRERREHVSEGPTPEGTYRERSVHRGFEASNAIDVRIEDPSLAGRLIQRAVDDAEAFVDGPWWRVDAGNPAHLDACRAAAEDARRRAEAFAGALGLRLGAVRSIEEPASGPWERGGGAMLSGGARAVAAQELGIEANLEISASVTVTYAIE